MPPPLPDSPVSMFIGGANGHAEVRLRSLAQTPLQVSVRELSAARAPLSQAQVTLEPRKPLTVGVNEGLEMRSGDVIVLHTDGYSDHEPLSVP